MDLLSESDINYFLSIIIPLVLIILIYWLIDQHNHETFISNRYCNECVNLDPYECSACTNCGTCYGYNGISQCVPGDEYGPYFRSDCIAWDTNRYNMPIISPIYYHPRPIINPYYSWFDWVPPYWGYDNYYHSYNHAHNHNDNKDKEENKIPEPKRRDRSASPTRISPDRTSISDGSYRSAKENARSNSVSRGKNVQR
jgi:hypothetical protein